MHWYQHRPPIRPISHRWIWGKGAIVQDLLVNKIHIPGDPPGIRVQMFSTPSWPSYSYFCMNLWMECQVLQGPRTNLFVGFLSCHLTRHLASLAHWHPSHLHRPECSWSVGADKIVRIIVSFQKLRTWYYIYILYGILVLWFMNPSTSSIWGGDEDGWGVWSDMTRWLITWHTVRRAGCEFCQGVDAAGKFELITMRCFVTSPCQQRSVCSPVISLEISSSFLAQRALSSCKSLKVELSECQS